MLKIENVDIRNKQSQLSFKRTFRNLSILPEHPCALEWDNLHEGRKNLIKEMQGLLDRCEEEKRDLSETEEVAYKFAEMYLEEIQKDIKRRESTGDRNASDPKEVARQFQYPDTQTISVRNVIPKEKRKYQDMFPKDNLSKEDFENFDDFCHVVTANRADDRLEKLEKRTFIAGSGPSGGYAVPSAFAKEIFDQSLEGEIVRSRARIFPVEQGLSITIPAWSHENHSTSLYGGYTAEWGSEDSNSTVQTGKLRSMTMNLHKLRLYTEVSREALTGGIGFDQQIGMSMTQSMGYFLDESYISGNGVGKPLGYLNSGCLVSVPRTGTTSIVYTDVVNMYSRLAPQVVKGAVWLANVSCLPKLLAMKDDSSALIPLYTQGVGSEIKLSLFGLPLIPTEKTPSLGVTGDLSLCAFSEYAIAISGNLVFEQSNAPGWSRDVLSYRTIVMTNGQPLWSTSIQPRDGSTNTLSPFVALSSATV